MRLTMVGLVLGVAATVAITASTSSAATTKHSESVDVVEVTAFYGATGIACRLYDTETGELLYDPAA